MKRIADPQHIHLYTNDHHEPGTTIRRDGHLWRVISREDTGGTERWKYRLERAR